ncbi:MAG: hypothetical protein DMF78_01150 [Acidobacteria bacterium]|nr:MAG: hypothetical protein DMF78_01150 [Acidobacteriota bacterium]
MRALTDAGRLREFMEALGREARAETRVYFTGGASAVLLGWRAATIDADIKVVPDRDDVFRALPALKERLRINVELAAPSDFIPELPGWKDRSPFIAREGLVSFHHYDFYAQALAKIERGHAQDRSDVENMLRSGLVDPTRLRDLFHQIESRLDRYPAIDLAEFARGVEEALKGR